MPEPLPSTQLTESGKNAAGLLILTSIALIFFSPLLFEGKVIFYRDFQFITYPIRYFLAQSFHQGVIPYWTPHTFGGMPFMATLHPGVFYPPSVIFFLNDYHLALGLFYVFHFLMLGAFAFLLGRLWNLSWIAAMCCGVTAMLGGMVVASALCSNYFLSSAWFPLVVWLYYRFDRKKQMAYFALLVLAIAGQTLAACPEISVMTMLILYAHALTFMPVEERRSGVLQTTGVMGLAVVLALGLIAFQLVPTAQLIKHTFRGSGVDFELHTRWSLELSKLTTFVLSPGYREYLSLPLHKELDMFSGLLHTLYMGIFGFVFLALGTLLCRSRAVAFWLVIFCSGIFFALGKNNLVYEYIYKWTPFLNLFRYPEKYLFATSMAAVFLIGFVLDALIQAAVSRKIPIFRVVALLVGVFAVTSWVALSNPYLEPQLPLAFIFVFSVATVLLYFNRIHRHLFAGLVFLMILMDLSLKGFQLLPMIDGKFYTERPRLTELIEASPQSFRTYSGRVDTKPDPMSYPNGPTRLAGMKAARQHFYPLGGMVYGIEHAGGVPGLAMDIHNHIVWYQNLIHSEPETRRRILKRTNVKYWIDGDAETLYSTDGNPVMLPERMKVWEDALPRAFLVPNLRVVERKQILNTFYGESFDPYREVILFDPVDFQPSPQFKGEVKQVAYRTNGVTVKTAQEGNGFLVLLDTYLRGWSVKVDGKEQPILNAYGLYRAVQLEPGEHTLEFEYFPEGFRAGLIGSGVTLVLALLVCGFWKPAGRRKAALQKADPPNPLPGEVHES